MKNPFSKFYFILSFTLVIGLSTTSFTSSNQRIGDTVEVLLSNTINQQSVQCNGTTTKGKRCKNKTTNKSGYCYIHVGQSNPNYNPQSNRLSSSTRCTSNTKSGNRCKRKTYCKNKKCSSHGGNCY